MFHKQIGTGYYALVSSGRPTSADKAFVRAAFDKAFSTPIELSEPVQMSKPAQPIIPETAVELVSIRRDGSKQMDLPS